MSFTDFSTVNCCHLSGLWLLREVFHKYIDKAGAHVLYSEWIKTDITVYRVKQSECLPVGVKVKDGTVGTEKKEIKLLLN